MGVRMTAGTDGSGAVLGTAGPVAILVGAPGAGKTTIGTALAQRLGVGFRDTDHDVEEIAGKSVPDVFLDDGEDAFRALERGAVMVALREHTGVLSLGGGAVLDEGTRALLRGRPVVWLRVTAAQAAARVGVSGARPLLMGPMRSKLITLLQERTPLYEEVATITIDTDGRSVTDIVAAIVEALPGGPR